MHVAAGATRDWLTSASQIAVKVHSDKRVRLCLLAGLAMAAQLGAQDAGAQQSGIAPPPRAALPDAPGTCHLRGVIRSSGGGPIAGAHITLSAGDRVLREADSNPDGSYAWDGIPAGTYFVNVTMQGFLPARYQAVLPEEGGTAQISITLQIQPLNASVTVTASETEMAQAELTLEEKQRLLGIFPNFFASYEWRAAPLSSRQKFGLAWKNARDPGNLLLVGVVAGVQQAANSFPGYGQGAKGYGRRYGADLGNLVSGTFLGGAVLPSLFHQDPRYFYKGTGSTPSRVWYATTRAVVTRGDNGRSQPNWSGMLGDMSAGALSNAYYAPEDRQGASLTIENGLLGIAGDAMNGVFQEFFLKKLTTNTKGRGGKATDAP